MCGIAGYWNMGDPAREDPAAVVARMIGPLERRGPDDAGVWAAPEGELALGHRRLAILDLSPAGAQPMASADGRFVIVFNGEIYNFRELRKELEAEGDSFRTGTDTEVILAAWRRHGPGCLARFNGMFAFAVWDGERKELFLARDRFGVKPLLFHHGNGLFLFASEMKGLRAGGAARLTLNLPALHRYFHLTYIPSPDTVYNEVLRLEAGHYLKVSRESVSCRRWYDLAPFYRGEPLRRMEEGEERLREAMEESVRARMVADVPVGLFLSGGVDSGILAALMARNSRGKIRTFTIGYKDSPVYDESARAARIAAHFGTEHTEILLSIRDGLAVIPEVLDYLDQPFVKVALSGDGGDEVFAGYSKYQAESYARLFGLLPGTARDFVRRCVTNLPEGRRSPVHEFSRRVKKAIRTADPDQVARHCALMFPLAGEEMAALVDPGAAAEIRRRVAEWMAQVTDGAGIDVVNRALYTDVNLCLKDDMLVKVDLMGMSNSLEIRNPFLDYRVVELAAGMPGGWKLKGLRRKRVLLAAFRGLLPRWSLHGPKRGFGIPVGEWLRTDLKGMFEDVVSRRKVDRAGVLRYDAVNGIFRAHLSGRRDATPLLWSVLAFQWWADRNL
jgi:asparagine synthase (glutamine-hydrolysing)